MKSFSRLFEEADWNLSPILRIVLLSGFILPRLSPQMDRFSANCGLDRIFMEPSLFSSLSPIPYSVTCSLVEPLLLTLQILGLLALCGFFTRLSLFLFGLLLGHVVGLNNSWGTFNHVISLEILMVFLLSVLPGVEALSIDNFLKWIREGKPKGKLVEYVKGKNVPVWHSTAILLLLSLIYFNAGFSKLLYGGWEFLNGSILRYYLSGETDQEVFLVAGRNAELWRDGIGLTHYLYSTPSSELGRYLSSQPVIVSVLAIGAVFIELFFPLALLSVRLRNFFLSAAVLFHLLSDYLMDVAFYSYAAICFILIDWPSLFSNWFGCKSLFAFVSRIPSRLNRKNGKIIPAAD